MSPSIDSILTALAQDRSDSRIHYFNLQFNASPAQPALSGRVLDEHDLQTLRDALSVVGVVDISAVEVLRKPANPILSVSTNLTSLHREPSFLAEMLSQLVNGMQVELLFEQGRWCFVRQMDGYLGWMYRPCLTGAPSLPATHFLATPVEALFARAGSGSPIATRVLGGTALAVLNVINGQAEIELTGGLRGWLPEASLRALAQIPSASALRREQIIRDAAAWTGTPYLWGGSSANGIDCSGLAQLAHRLAGLTIPRDADMQCAAGRKVEAPYRAGDLLFFGEHGEKRRVTHVAISLGGWQIIHSSRSNNGVYCDDVQAVPHLKESFLEAVTFLDD